MKVLVLGGGGREHALVWKLKQSPLVQKIWCAPGNGGIAEDAECVAIDAGDVPAVVAFAEKNQPDLTVVGPELPLVSGVTDAFRKRGWPIVGSSQQAAQLEGRKIFAKEFLERHRIATAKVIGKFEDSRSALRALESATYPLVIKADGLCAGKGVVLPDDFAAAKDFVERVMDKNELGPGGKRILVEEILEGDELSFILLTDGKRFAPMVPTRDHKRVFDGNLGPNTGGMGAYSTDELMPPQLEKAILSKVVEPTLEGLRSDGIAYQGFLYIGLMLTDAGPKVLEFNCRLGDPEAQAIVARLDCDLAEILRDLATDRFEPDKFQWKSGASACVVLASGGYPGKFQSGKRIEGLTILSDKNGVKALHAGTRLEGGHIVTSGGRVLGLTASAATLNTALASVYEAVGKIHFDGMHYRKDIGAHFNQRRAAGD